MWVAGQNTHKLPLLWLASIFPCTTTWGHPRCELQARNLPLLLQFRVEQSPVQFTCLDKQQVTASRTNQGTSPYRRLSDGATSMYRGVLTDWKKELGNTKPVKHSLLHLFLSFFSTYQIQVVEDTGNTEVKAREIKIPRVMFESFYPYVNPQQNG